MHSSDAPSSTMQSDALECPRCGHGLDGNAKAAHERGDSSGTCSECGLCFTWSDLLETRSDPRWFVESRRIAGAPRRWPSRLLGTLAACVHPFWFWSRVKMTIPHDPRGIALFLALVAALAYLIPAARNIHTLATVGGGWVPAPAAAGAAAGTSSWVLTGSRNPYDYLAAALVPLSSVTVSECVTKINSQRRPGDPRIAAVEMSWRVSVAILEDAGFWPPAWMPGRAKNPDIPFVYILQSDNSSIHARRAFVRLACVAPVPFLAPFAIALLPISMRRARIRRQHLLRGAVYSLVILLPILGLYFLTPEGFGTRAGPEFHLAPHALLACTLPIVFVWNWAFSRAYLKLEHAAAVAASNTVLSALLSLFAQRAYLGWI